MAGRTKLACPIIVFLAVFLPFVATAQDISFSAVPAEIRIDDLPLGQPAQFKLTIRNKDGIARNFTITTFQPSEEERREGRAAFPDVTWITSSPSDVEVSADSAANVTVTIAIPREQEWANQNWEIWLAVTAESTDILGARLFVRLLVSSTSPARARLNAGLFAAIAVTIVLLGYGTYYYFRRRTKHG
jgi:hypothetical protein